MKRTLLIMPALLMLTACSTPPPKLAKARALYDEGKYFEARDIGEKLLIEDSYNKETILIRELERRIG